MAEFLFQEELQKFKTHQVKCNTILDVNKNPHPLKKNRKKPCMVYILSQWSHECPRVWDVTMLPHLLFRDTHCSSFGCSAVYQKPAIGIVRIGTLDRKRAMRRQGQAHHTLQPKSAAGMLGKDQRNEPEGPRNARPARAGMVVAL